MSKDQRLNPATPRNRDRAGFAIIEGCIVSVDRPSWRATKRAWVKEVRANSVVLTDEDAKRHVVRMSEVVVQKPSIFQKARKIGVAKTIEATNANARKARLLQRRKS